MRKTTTVTVRNNESAAQPIVKSKYFSIDSYFKTPSSTIPTKRKRQDFDQQEVEKAIEASLKEVPVVATKQAADKQPCPLCAKVIESESLQVHVNHCLDSIQEEEKENQPPSVRVDNTTQWKEKFVCESVTTVEKESQPSSLVRVENTTKCETEVESVTTVEKKKSANENAIDTTILEKEKPTRVLPTLWKDKFSSSSSVTATATPLEMKNVNISLKTPSLRNNSKTNKICPFYKRVNDTRFTVDAFSYGKIADCDGYFLTHYHSDHYGGLRASWTHGPIYCSQVTANLVKQELGVQSHYVHALPMNQRYPIPKSNVDVVLLDANHCPGSALILFIIKDKENRRHLHTGDFRAQPKMCLNEFIKQPENPTIHTLYLDTTYMSPQYAFPAQEEAIQAVCDVVILELGPKDKKKTGLDHWFSPVKPQQKEQQGLMTTTKNAFKLLMSSPLPSPPKRKQVLIVVGTYTIGKERVFINIARLLKCKIFAPPKKHKILLCQEDPELESLLTKDPLEAQVHVVSLRDIKPDMMYGYLDLHKTHFSSIIAFKPTGWTYQSTTIETKDMTTAPLSHIIEPPPDRTIKLQPYYNKNNVKLYGVPYSEHSSFRELASFVASLDIVNIIPTVNMGQVNKMKTDYFDKWHQEKLSKRIEVVAHPNQDHW